MMTDDIRKLLGGYATGTLTEEERQALLAAALEDQLVFDALVDEQLLKELLDDGTARAQLLQATEAARFSIRGVLREWFDRPKAKALVAFGVLLVMVIAVREAGQHPAQREEPQTVAVLRDVPAPPPAQAQEPAAAVPQEKATAKALKRSVTPPAAPLKAVEQAAGATEKSELRAASSLADANVAPDSATRIATNGDLQMKYTVLLRNAAGEFTPVPAGYEFAPGDRARVRVELNQEGVISLTGSDRKPLYVRNVAAATPTVLPYEIGFDQPGTQELQIAFLKAAPLPAVEASPVMQFSEEQKAAAPRARTMAAASPATPAPSVTVVLQLRRKP